MGGEGRKERRKEVRKGERKPHKFLGIERKIFILVF